jgi:hypothetical protein
MLTTKKHFRQIANAVRMIRDMETRREIAAMHAEMCARENPRFETAKFYAACNVSTR